MIGDLLVAVDLGAASGRVMIGRLAAGRLEHEEVHRFPNGPFAERDGLWWDIERLTAEVVAGLRLAADRGRVAGIGIDTWGCDVGFLGSDGQLLARPRHHRDPRNAAAVQRVHARMSASALYARNGLQHLPFNTIFQVEAARTDQWFGEARSMVLIPDLLGYRLTGRIVSEMTNASTTGLLDPWSRDWDVELARLVGLDPDVLPPLAEPGSILGGLSREAAEVTGIDSGTPVILVGSHDTASAVAAVPASNSRFAYISSGTWSLVGAELPGPNLSDAGRLAGFTNEGGIDGTTRYLHNVMGLWLLQQSMAAWEREATDVRLADLLVAAADVHDGPVFDPDDPRFMTPSEMPSRIVDACLVGGNPLKPDPVHVTRAILDSLAAAYARTLSSLTHLIGWAPEIVHIVGGGSQNELLCQLTADSTRLAVLAGPSEATAIGNLLMQARALGLLDGSLDAMRAITRQHENLRRYVPAVSLPAP